jgi:hypothetical protein
MVRLAGQCVKAALTGLVAGYALAFVLSLSVWLDMRVNLGYVIPACLVCFLLFHLVTKGRVRLMPFLFFELLAVALLFAIYGLSTSALLIVPASLFREGFHLDSLSLPRIGLLLLCVLAMANAVWIFTAATARRKNRGRS